MPFGQRLEDTDIRRSGFDDAERIAAEGIASLVEA
jgi:hypothetical protein